MNLIKVSSKFQIVIPKEIRRNMNIKAGQILQIFQFGDKLELMPVKNLKTSRGFLKGIDVNIAREKDRV